MKVKAKQSKTFIDAPASARNAAKASRLIKAQVLILFALAVLCVSACSCTANTDRPAETQTPYVRPSTRVIAGDPAPFEKIEPMMYYSNYSFASKLRYDSEVTELRSPVAVLMSEKATGEYSYADTDIFETTSDLSEAASILFIKVTDQFSAIDPAADKVQYEHKLTYECYLISSDCSEAGKLSVPGEQFSTLVYNTTVNSGKRFYYTADEACDEAFFRFLSSKISISPDASNDAVEALDYSTSYSLENDYELLLKSCEAYAYPEESNLSLHPELLDTARPLVLYSADTSIAAPGMNPEDYVRPEAVLLTLSEGEYVTRGTQDVWAKVSRGELDRLIGLTEYVGAKFWQTFDGLGSVYLHISRCTIVDPETGDVIGWCLNDPVVATQNTISSNNVYTQGGIYFKAGTWSGGIQFLEMLYGASD